MRRDLESLVNANSAGDQVMRPERDTLSWSSNVVGAFADRLDDSIGRRRFLGSPIEKFTVALIALLPFLPRPTLEHPIRFVVPIFALVFLLINANRLIAAVSSVPREARVKELVAIGAVLFVGYFGWSVINAQSSELSRVFARGLWIAVYLSMVIWFFCTAVSLSRIYKCIFLSSVALSILVIFVGLTGVTIFEAPIPGRTYGVAIPFFKNTGVPRSYGEFGVLMSIAWAYWLVHFRQMPISTRVITGILLVTAIFISQSRSTYLAILVISGACAVNWLVRNTSDKARKTAFKLMLVGAILLPALLELVLASPIGRIGFVEAMIGQETFEENVLTRFLIISSALDALLEGGASALFGISHAVWDANFEVIGQRPIALHNHFLSNLVFYGLIGGTLSLFAFFLYPFLGVLRRQIQFRDRTSLVALLALFGGIVNLHFYEGFFSLILALELALLWCVGRGIMLETRNFKTTRFANDLERAT
ncbi:MAG: O-antigen ligase family protein [Woeseiaceae bacterium]